MSDTQLDAFSAGEHPADHLEAWARSSVQSDDAERMVTIASRAAAIRAEFEGGFFAWQVTLDMAKAGLLDGTEKRDGFGSIGFRLGMRSTDRYARVPVELPPEYLTHGTGHPVQPERVRVMQMILKRSHSNRATWWRVPTANERAEAMERAKARGVA